MFDKVWKLLVLGVLVVGLLVWMHQGRYQVQSLGQQGLVVVVDTHTGHLELARIDYQDPDHARMVWPTPPTR